MARTASATYQDSLWRNADSTDTSQDALKGNDILKTHFLAGGAVAMVAINPVPPPQQSAARGYEDRLLSNEQISALEAILLGPGRSPLIRVLLLVSPIPILAEDPRVIDYSFLSAGQRGIRYTSEELIRLLDIMSNWMSEESEEGHVFGRKVVFVCGGAPTGYKTVIKGYHMDDMDREALLKRNPLVSEPKPGSALDLEADIEFLQICVGHVTGPPLDQPPLQLMPGELISRPSSSSAGIRYRYYHRVFDSSAAPHCGVVELHGLASLHSNDSKPEKKRADIRIMCSHQTVSDLADIYERSISAAGDPWYCRIPEEVAFAWRGVDAAMSGAYGSDKDAGVLSQAVRGAMATTAAREVLSRCHDMLKDGTFGLLNSTNASAEPILSALLIWARKEMEAAGLNFKLTDPSPHVVRRMWTGLCGRVWSALSTNISKEVKDPVEELVLSTIHKDSDILSQFIRETFEATMILQHCAATRGLNDGW